MLPNPPADLASVALPIHTLSASLTGYRIHRPADNPIWFGPAKPQVPMYRFDDPRGIYGGKACHEEDDPDDGYVTAVVTWLAEYVVSGDRHLLGLGTYGAITIVSTRRSLQLLAAS